MVSLFLLTNKGGESSSSMEWPVPWGNANLNLHSGSLESCEWGSMSPLPNPGHCWRELRRSRKRKWQRALLEYTWAFGSNQASCANLSLGDQVYHDDTWCALRVQQKWISLFPTLRKCQGPASPSAACSWWVRYVYKAVSQLYLEFSCRYVWKKYVHVFVPKKWLWIELTEEENWYDRPTNRGGYLTWLACHKAYNLQLSVTFLIYLQYLICGAYESACTITTIRLLCGLAMTYMWKKKTLYD